MVNEKQPKERFDWTLLFILFLFFVISIVAIASAQTTDLDAVNYALKQAIFYGLGAIIIAVALYFDPEQYKMMADYLYWAGVAVLTFMLTPLANSFLADLYIRSWLSIPLIGTLQPSEIMKVFMIIMVSKVIAKHHEKIIKPTLKTDLWLLAKITFYCFIPLGLVALQPDMGTSIVYVVIYVGMVFVSGVSWRLFLPAATTIAAIGATALLLVIYKPEFLDQHFGIEKYKFDRIYTWIDPYSYATNEGYNLVQVLRAIGSGEITGKGFLGKEVHVPEQHTDFIFSVIGEEFGFIGASFVIILFFFLIYHIIRIGLATKDPFSSYICSGIVTMITFHVLENIGMQLQLLPITGIPLPFISYGGSALLGNMLGIGIIFSIRYYHRTYMFSSEEE